MLLYNTLGNKVLFSLLLFVFAVASRMLIKNKPHWGVGFYKIFKLALYNLRFKTSWILVRWFIISFKINFRR